jgi:hypothetical protein
VTAPTAEEGLKAEAEAFMDHFRLPASGNLYGKTIKQPMVLSP